jgi:GMP synthase-like glutamine amidotransferase
MKKEILIVKNIINEGPGLLEEILKEKKIEYFIVELGKRENIPPVENFGAVVILGGPMSANDTDEIMESELEFIRKVISSKTPYLGICLGLQTLVKATGGKVVQSPLKEVGFLDPEGNNFIIELTDKGKEDPLFEGLNSPFKVFHLHGETVELTNDMVLLATGKFCHNQVIKIGTNAYGIQSHFELTPDMFEEWITLDPDLLKLDTEYLRSIFNEIKGEYTKTGKQLLENFLTIAGY